MNQKSFANSSLYKKTKALAYLLLIIIFISLVKLLNSFACLISASMSAIYIKVSSD